VSSAGQEFRPTAALVRAVVLAAGTGILALLSSQPALAVLAVPFVVWSVLGMIRRPPADSPPPVAALSARAIAAGDAVEVAVRSAAEDRVVDLALSPQAGADLAPTWGAVCGLQTATVRVRPQRWGRLDLDDALVRESDEAGLWQRDVRLRLGSIEVSPSAIVPGRGDAIPHPIGTAGIHQSRRPGDGSALADIRRYLPGDRLSRINWRVSARTGILHTNATTADRDTDVLIVMDTLADVTTAELSGPFASSLDATVVAAASLAEHYLRLGDRVGVHDLGAVVGDLPPRGGIRQFAALTTRLARVSRTDVTRGDLRPVQRLRPGTFAVVCSPLLDDDVLTEIAVLARRGAAVLVVDTLPERIGRLEPGPADRSGPLAHLIDPAPGSFWEEAWVLRRLQRDADVTRLREVGIPVAPWQGVGGVATLAAALAAQRPTARAGGAPR